jgi:hypothetical protein
VKIFFHDEMRRGRQQDGIARRQVGSEIDGAAR